MVTMSTLVLSVSDAGVTMTPSDIRQVSAPATTYDHRDVIRLAHQVATRNSRLTNVCSDANRRQREPLGATVYYHKLRLFDAMVPRSWLRVRHLGSIALKSAVS